MLEIDIKILPFGDRKKKRLLFRLHIVNDATGDAEVGNYRASMRVGSQGILISSCRIKNFPRLKLNAFNLLYIVLKKMIGGTNVRHKTTIQAFTKEAVLAEAQQQITS